MPDIVLDNLYSFPTSVGFGRNATGGRGGELRRVTTLANSGAGSLRLALETHGAAIIIFEVSGIIDVVGSRITPTDNKTIEGATAFRNGGQGITLRMNPNSRGSFPLIGNSNPSSSPSFGNIVWRYIRFRRGEGLSPETSGGNYSPWSTGQSRGYHVFDHCSFSWSTDQNVDSTGTDGIFLQYCITSEGLLWASHAYSTDTSNGAYPNGHSKGSLIEGTPEIGWHGCLFSSNDERNPLVQASGGGVTEIQFSNNIIYNRGRAGIQWTTSGNSFYNANVINNIWKDGQNSTTSRWGFQWPSNKSTSSKIFVEGNISPRRPNDLNQTLENQWQVVGEWDDNGVSPLRTTFQVNSKFDFLVPDNTILSTTELENVMLPHIGATLNGFRDNADNRAVESYINNTGILVNADGDTRSDRPGNVGQFTDITGGWEPLNNMTSVPLDSNGDGIPDDFVSSWNITNNAGYSDLELYLAEISGDFDRLSGIVIEPPLIDLLGRNLSAQNIFINN